MGTTVRVASIRDDGHTFHDSLTPINVHDERSRRRRRWARVECLPSRSSTSSKFMIESFNAKDALDARRSIGSGRCRVQRRGGEVVEVEEIGNAV